MTENLLLHSKPSLSLGFSRGTSDTDKTFVKNHKELEEKSHNKLLPQRFFFFAKHRVIALSFT